MIITRLNGGLGNQMFQYAFGRIASLKRSKAGKAEELKLDITGYGAPKMNIRLEPDTYRAFRLGFFNIQAEIATTEEVRKAKYPLGIISKGWRGFKHKLLRKFYIDYHPEQMDRLAKSGGIFAAIKDRIFPPYADGFFQSELYFNAPEFRSAIVSDFQLKPEWISPAMKDIDDVIRQAEGSVSLHVRRGDYVSHKTVAKVQGACSPEYYAEAISRIASSVPNPHFFIFSDDIEWVKQNIPIGHIATYVSNPALKDYEELVLMSHCKHNIIGNSTFSWWGAWLNQNPDKTVIAPKRWTARNTENPNIIPAGWIRI